MKKFTGKTVLVVGGGSGIGLALCHALSAMNAKVYAGDIRLEACTGTSIRSVPMDISSTESIVSAFQLVLEQAGRLDMVFNCAATSIIADVIDMDDADWEKIISVNLMGVIRSSDAAYRIMVKQGGGTIVNIASIAGLVPLPFFSTAYNTTKSGIVGYTRCLELEAKGNKVDVILVCPGKVDTNLVNRGKTIRLDEKIFDTISPFKGITAQAAAMHILRGLSARKSLILFPWYTKWMNAFYRLAPGLWFLYALRQIEFLRRSR